MMMLEEALSSQRILLVVQLVLMDRWCLTYLQSDG